MKIPLKWLSEYVDLSGIQDDKVSSALTMSGTENEIIKDTATFPKIVVGEIKNITKHPNADKLQVTRTDVGLKNGGVLQIVCGAPNIEAGQKVPVALVGAVIGEFEIKEAEIRGVKSHGMLCSESELGISDDHTGIMILDARAKVGVPLEDALNIGGTVLEAEITPNRGDCLSVIGVAREASAVLDRKLKNINFKVPEIRSKEKVKVEVKEKELCPRYIAKVVEGVKIGPSPKWMQEALSAAGVRPISNVVDVTNYVMLEWGQPLHAFDAKKIAGKIIVRKAKSGEKHTTLDGVVRDLTTKDLVIADTKKIIALAGVMGGLNSEVTDDTTKVVLEAAVFDSVSVRKTAQRLALRSEASNRFEKGIPLTLPEIAIERAAGLLTEIPGGLTGNKPVVKPKAGEKTDVLSRWNWVQHVGLELSRLNDFMGIDISVEKAVNILKSLGFEAEKFDFKKEARKHVGKPYILGASYKTHKDMAFDCSYLTDYIYSLIGKFVGHTALAQYAIGEPVEGRDLKPGDILFVNGVVNESATNHYYVPDGKGGHEKVTLKSPIKVGHCALYIGNDRIIHARHYEYDMKNKKWKKLPAGKVVEESVEAFTKNPEYIGARRFIQNPEDFIAITVPWWRLDVAIPEDILEEIGRIYGYENLPSVLPSGKLPHFSKNVMQRLEEQIREILSGAGLSEVINYSFISKNQLASFGYDEKRALKIANPINPEQEYMRQSLVPSLLSDTYVNQDNYDEFGIFEIASVYFKSKGELPDEEVKIGLSFKSKKRGAKAFFELKGALELLTKKLNISGLRYKKEKRDRLESGQTATIYIGNEKVGYIGMTSEVLSGEYGLKVPIAVAELDLKTIAKYSSRDFVYKTISRYPTITRDVNILFSEDKTAEDIEGALVKAEVSDLKEARIVDIFRGGDLPKGQKSVTIRLVFGSNEKTLKDETVAKDVKGIVSYLSKVLSGKERL